MGEFSTLSHLKAHHGDFAGFRDTMIETSKGRFGPLFWSVFEPFAGEFLVDGGTFVDLGTGPANLLKMMRQRFPDAGLVGVEIQPDMLVSARELVAELAGSARIIEADLAAPPVAGIEDNSAAVVLASMVLHELPMPTRLLQEARRILRPGGRLVLFDWIRHPLRLYRPELPLDAGDDELLDLFQHFNEHCSYTTDDLEFMATECGFAVKGSVVVNRGRHAILLLENPA